MSGMPMLMTSLLRSSTASFSQRFCQYICSSFCSQNIVACHHRFLACHTSYWCYNCLHIFVDSFTQQRFFYSSVQSGWLSLVMDIFFYVLSHHRKIDHFIQWWQFAVHRSAFFTYLPFSTEMFVINCRLSHKNAIKMVISHFYYETGTNYNFFCEK